MIIILICSNKLFLNKDSIKDESKFMCFHVKILFKFEKVDTFFPLVSIFFLYISTKISITLVIENLGLNSVLIFFK